MWVIRSNWNDDASGTRRIAPPAASPKSRLLVTGIIVSSTEATAAKAAMTVGAKVRNGICTTRSAAITATGTMIGTAS
ncbi:hypothetical protein ACH46_15530 [Gordonia phthalatica]|uniref:Uncharacterized protein n=1 Tax=Gordonia phthalatica TaxID=1136941 RepID=A0A0N9ND47_9ACTN|nr:hypothetical protein ACH46_15530 [Gordonia phthalatica]